MAEPLKVDIGFSAPTLQTLAAARAWPITLMRNCARAIDLENELTVGHIQARRMSRRGKETLGVVTNRARSSVHPTKAVIAGDAIESSIGSNVRYLGMHEFGFNGTVTVKEHRARHHSLDVFQYRGQLFRGWEVIGSGAKRPKQVASGFVTIRQHRRQMNIPARAPIRRGIEDRADAYREALGTAVMESFAA